MPGTFVPKVDYYTALKASHEVDYLPLSRMAG
jgi:hypothetical protein